MAVTHLWRFSNSVIAFLTIHMAGQCLAVLSSWHILSLFSTIPGLYRFSNFQPFLHLLTDSSTGYATALKPSQLRISHMRARCHFPKGIFISQVNASRVSTKHKKIYCTLSLSLGQFYGTLGISISPNLIFYTQSAIQGFNLAQNPVFLSLYMPFKTSSKVGPSHFSLTQESFLQCHLAWTCLAWGNNGREEENQDLCDS